MGDEVNNKSGEAVKLGKKKLELKPSNALNGKSLGENKIAPSETQLPQSKADSSELESQSPVESSSKIAAKGR